MAAEENKKPNIFVRMGRKIKETFSELKRVTWPTLPQAYANFLPTFVFLVGVGWDAVSITSSPSKTDGVKLLVPFHESIVDPRIHKAYTFTK